MPVAPLALSSAYRQDWAAPRMSDLWHSPLYFTMSAIIVVLYFVVVFFSIAVVTFVKVYFHDFLEMYQSLHRAEKCEMYAHAIKLLSLPIAILIGLLCWVSDGWTFLFLAPLFLLIMFFVHDKLLDKRNEYAQIRDDWQEQTRLRVFAWVDIIITYRLRSWKFRPPDVEQKLKEILACHPNPDLKNYEEALDITIERVEKPTSDEVEFGEGNVYLGDAKKLQ